MKSTEDSRTDNNVMRHNYKVLNDNEKIDMSAIKDLGSDLYRGIETIESHYLEGSAELELAKVKVEEAIMWAVKHITGPNVGIYPLHYNKNNG